MHFSKFILAALPALALAQDEGDLTTYTKTSTRVYTKTVTLSLAHPTAANASLPWPTGAASPSARVTGTGSLNSTLPTQIPHNAGVSVEASKVALAGVAGMIVIAML